MYGLTQHLDCENRELVFSGIAIQNMDVQNEAEPSPSLEPLSTGSRYPLGLPILEQLLLLLCSGRRRFLLPERRLSPHLQPNQTRL